MAKNLDYTYCKAAPMLDWIGNKWTLVVIMKISDCQPIRFNELYRNIPSISEKMLAQVLKQLLADGIVRRELYPDVPPRVEYSFTDLGLSLVPLIKSLAEWGHNNFNQIMHNRKLFNK